MAARELELQTSQKPSNGGTPAAPLPSEKRAERLFSILRDAPNEVTLTSVDSAYLEYREMTDTREPYRIPAEYLVGKCTKRFVGPGVADTPLVVFINAKSGGRVGPRLLTVLFRSLGQVQVFDLAESRPGPVLRAIWDNLTAREAAGDTLAGHIRRNLRILAAGGDGTVTWILKTIRELELEPPPAVAIMPLGTGNDLSLSFGWGNLFLDRWIAASQLYTTLKRFADASLRHLDCWSVRITAPADGYFPELPYALAAAPNNSHQADGLFWNYLSIGLDAEAAYGFHTMREAHSWAASNRALNQPLTNKLQLRVRDEEGGEWRDVTVPRSVRALVLLNIQSYGGGRDIVGLSDTTLLKGQEFRRAPIFDDGLIEVVGFGSGWHAAMTMAQVSSKVHAVRLTQCAEVELRLEARGGRVKGEQSYTHMQVDGEPWRQPIPAAPELVQRWSRPAGLQESRPPDGGAGAHQAPQLIQQQAQQQQQQQQQEEHQVVVHVAHAGRSCMLFNEGDPQGGKRVRNIVQRGAEVSIALASHFSMLWPQHSV